MSLQSHSSRQSEPSTRSNSLRSLEIVHPGINHFDRIELSRVTGEGVGGWADPISLLHLPVHLPAHCASETCHEHVANATIVSASEGD